MNDFLSRFDEEYDKNAQIKIDELKPRLTDEFLSTLVEAAKPCGWSIDHVETMSFVEWCHDIAEKEIPDVSAFEYGNDEI